MGSEVTMQHDDMFVREAGPLPQGSQSPDVGQYPSRFPIIPAVFYVHRIGEGEPNLPAGSSQTPKTTEELQTKN